MIGLNKSGQLVEDLSEYEILREAMVNQIAHADHFSTRRSCIRVFDDCIEFFNPGGMPMPLEVIERTFESQPRNPILSKLFRLAHLSESLGYGLHKLKQWNAVTGQTMQIDSTSSSVKVVFKLGKLSAGTQNVGKNVGKKIADRRRQIIDLITYNPKITRAEMALAIGVSIKTIERDIAALSEIVSYTGSQVDGYWTIKE